MFDQLPVVKLASAMARHATQRHGVIAGNVANADTPGYRARDVRAFSELVNDSFTPRATRAAHLGAIRGATHRLPETMVDRAVQPGPNGNSVALEAEMVKAVEAQGQHAIASAIYRKVHDLMRLGLGRGR